MFRRMLTLLALAVFASAAVAQDQTVERTTETAPDSNPLGNITHCWNHSARSQVVISVRFLLGEDGRVLDDNVTLINASEGSDNDKAVAFDAARRAVLRCQRDGYTMTTAIGAQKEIVLTFDPSKLQ